MRLAIARVVRVLNSKHYVKIDNAEKMLTERSKKALTEIEISALLLTTESSLIV